MAGQRGKKGEGRTRKRGRKEISSAETTTERSTTFQSSKDEDSISSPKLSRYPKRNSRAIASKPATLRSPVRNVTTRANRQSPRLNPLKESVPPPKFYRYPTRNSRAVTGKPATLRPPVRKVITRTTCQCSRLNPPKVRRIPNRKPALSQNGENALPFELQHCTSKHPPEDNDLISNPPAASPRYHHPENNTGHGYVTDTEMMNVVSLDNWSTPISKHVMDQQAAPFHQNNYVDIQAPTNFITNNHCLSRNNSNTSINVTEFAMRLHDDMDEVTDKAQSASLEDVWGYKVRSEFAPLLRRVFNKYGDIANKCDHKSSNIVSHYLQQLCRVCEQLERTKFLEVKRAELDSMLADVDDFEQAKLKVRWLRDRIKYVTQVWIDFQRYYSLKRELEKYDASIGSLEKQLDAYKCQLFDLQRKIGDVEGELEAKRAEAGPRRNVVLDTKARVKTLVKGNLVGGLF